MSIQRRQFGRPDHAAWPLPPFSQHSQNTLPAHLVFRNADQSLALLVVHDGRPGAAAQRAPRLRRAARRRPGRSWYSVATAKSPLRGAFSCPPPRRLPASGSSGGGPSSRRAHQTARRRHTARSRQHDVRPRDDAPAIEVHRLWDQIRSKYDGREIVGPEGSGRKIGIGVVRVPDTGINVAP